MPNYRIITAVCLGLALGACGKKPAPGEHVDAATQVGVSTGSALGSTLNAPGNYMRGMQGKVDKAEEAAAAYQKAAETHDGNKADSGE
jgi:hypothetical protein